MRGKAGTLLLCTMKEKLGSTQQKLESRISFSATHINLNGEKGQNLDVTFPTALQSYGKYKNTNRIRCHGSKETRPRKDKVTSTFNHAPNVLYSQIHNNKKGS